MTRSAADGAATERVAAKRVAPNRPKARSDADPLITAEQRRRRLGGSFARQQSLTEAQEYDAIRPRYPAQAVQQILDLAAPGSGSPRVVDLGAGTGILSRQLLAAGASVHAVEPSAAMTQVLESPAADRAERLQVSNADAEHTGLPDGEADIVVAAQAWHWFDPQAVQAEVRRLLTAGGGLALIWNYLDTADATVHRLTRIMRAGDVYRPGWRPALDTEKFTEPQTVEHRWSRTLTVGQVLRYATTLSSWLAADDDARARRRANLQDYLHRELGLNATDTVELPQITVLHTARLRHTAPGDQDLQR